VSFRGEGRRGYKKKKEKKKEGESERNRRHWEGSALRGSFFFIIQNSSHLRELKNCIRKRFWRIYMNSLNLIFVVIIFLKFKIY